MTFVDYLNIVFQVIKSYISMLFSLVVSPGVTIGSIFLVASLLFVIVVNVWPRA